MLFRKNTQESHWQSISDLMTGLMVIFLFVCLGFLYQLNQVKEKYNMERIAIYDELNKEFKPEEMARWGARIDEHSLTVSFVEPSVFFDSGSAQVKPGFQNMLNDFFPRYINVLKRHSDSIIEVRIEGNASKEWNGGDPNSSAAYYYNMKLSQDRAFNVLQYVYAIPAVYEDRLWLQEKLRANGASYSKANENVGASRCVEISIRRNAERNLETLVKDLMGDSASKGETSGALGTIGGISLRGTTIDNVEKVYGRPDLVSKATQWSDCYIYGGSNEYAPFVVYFNRDTRTITGIMVRQGSYLSQRIKTSKNVGIGSSESEMIKAYGNPESSEPSQPGTKYVYHENDEIIEFWILNGVVVDIHSIVA